MKLVRPLAFASLALVATMTLGCAQEVSPSDGSEVVDSQKQAFESFGPRPLPYNFERARHVAAQRRARLMLAYSNGGASPFASYPCGNSTDQASLQSYLTWFRNLVSSNKITWTNRGASTRGPYNLRAIIYALAWNYAAGNPTESDTFGFANMNAAADKCWNLPVTTYLAPQAGSNTEEFDPEPADLQADLTGGAGSSASAIFVNTGEETTVRKWYSGWTASPSLAVGTPCSTTTMYAGETSYKEIVGLGNYRKCL